MKSNKLYNGKKNMKLIVQIMGAALLIGVLFGGYIWSGAYTIGADVPHWRVTAQMMDLVRQRAVEHHAKDIKVPRLDDPQLILKGAGQYAAMCTQCHLAPNRKNSELREGLYPLPPDLSKMRVEPRIAFWAIKHGIKMSAMPAWGVNHDDATIWSMVAFLQKLPDLSARQYRDIVAKAPPDDDMHM